MPDVEAEGSARGWVPPHKKAPKVEMVNRQQLVEAAGRGRRMRPVGQFLIRFWVAVLALSILLSVLSLIDLVKVARKVWGWRREVHTPELLRPPR
jgi:hypothetical protein